MKYDEKCWDDINIIQYWDDIARDVCQEMFGQTVRLWKVATPHGRASQHLSSGAAPKCTAVFLWCLGKKLQICGNFVFEFKKKDLIVEICCVKKQDVFDFDVFFCAKDLDNCEFDFSNCSNVQSGESCEIKCNPPYVLAAAWQNRYPSARNVLSLEMDWSAGQLLAPSCCAFSVGRI